MHLSLARLSKTVWARGARLSAPSRTSRSSRRSPQAASGLLDFAKNPHHGYSSFVSCVDVGPQTRLEKPARRRVLAILGTWDEDSNRLSLGMGQRDRQWQCSGIATTRS